MDSLYERRDLPGISKLCEGKTLVERGEKTKRRKGNSGGGGLS